MFLHVRHSSCSLGLTTHESSSLMTTARFDPTGRYAFVGTSAGTVEVYNVRTKMVSSYLGIH